MWTSVWTRANLKGLAQGESTEKHWSGWADSNCRPAARKADCGNLRDLPAFNYFRFKQLRLSCCDVWSGLETRGFQQLQIYLHYDSGD
jgi:hypothetical protein